MARPMTNVSHKPHVCVAENIKVQLSEEFEDELQDWYAHALNIGHPERKALGYYKE
jgi:hypothetical protein